MCLLLRTVCFLDGAVQVQVDFEVTPEKQFDQGGIMVFRDTETWLKTGIEVVDGTPRLSCVVTRHGFSDWSTQPWPATSMTIRLSQTGDGSYVVEVGSSSSSSSSSGSMLGQY